MLKDADELAFGGVLETEYVKKRKACDATLDEPRLLWQPIQANIRAGTYRIKFFPSLKKRPL